MELTKNKIKTAVTIIAVTMAIYGALFAGASHAAGQEKSLQDNMNLVTFSYLRIHEALTADSVDGVREHANSIVTFVDSALKLTGADKGNDLKKALGDVEKAAKPLTDKKLKLDGARAAFAPLSEAIITLVKNYFPPELASRYFVFNCPMKNSNWVQTYPTARNPYFGSEMINCGNIVTMETAAPGADYRLQGNSQTSALPQSGPNQGHYYGCGHYNGSMSHGEQGHYYGCSHYINSDGYHQHYDGCGHYDGRNNRGWGCW